jgi:hypothetical protein
MQCQTIQIAEKTPGEMEGVGAGPTPTAIGAIFARSILRIFNDRRIGHSGGLRQGCPLNSRGVNGG